mgnify:CR=1 FL=1
MDGRTKYDPRQEIESQTASRRGLTPIFFFFFFIQPTFIQEAISHAIQRDACDHHDQATGC